MRIIGAFQRTEEIHLFSFILKIIVYEFNQDLICFLLFLIQCVRIRRKENSGVLINQGNYAKKIIKNLRRTVVT